MKRNNHKLTEIQKRIIFFAQKLPLVKQAEALDFIKWLWISKKPASEQKAKFEKLLKNVWNKVQKEPITEEEIDKIVEEARAERYADSSH